MSLEIIILAAGKGSRMRSELPKVLHPIAGTPLLHHVLTTAEALQPDAIHVVVGHQAESVKTVFSDWQTGGPTKGQINWVTQEEQNGTGHAVAQALPSVNPDSTVLIMNGDVPLIAAETLSPMCAVPTGIHLLTVNLENPTGFGRLLRDQETQAVLGIVEEKDADASQRQIQEINTGLMSMPTRQLSDWLSRISNDNAQGEYYLTDVFAFAVEDGLPIKTSLATNPDSVMGINSRAELAYLERVTQRNRAQTLMDQGITLADPARIDQRGEVAVGSDSFIDINAVIENSRIGSNVHIGPNVFIRNSQLEDGVVIEANSVIDGATIGSTSNIGPFARLRPETHLAEHTKIGNFVEVKKSRIARGAKVNHLSYVGDAEVGANTNIGAGVITCNYDGANKHQTIIGKEVFVGSDCQLIAPVKIGDNATIGAGSTIAKAVPADGLTLTRTQQRTIPDWKRPTKEK